MSFWSFVDDMAETLDSFLQGQEEDEEGNDHDEHQVFLEVHHALEERGDKLHALENHMNDLGQEVSVTAQLARELREEAAASQKGCFGF
jgi:hypothetical protein